MAITLFPVFSTRPDDAYLSRWRDHIEDTGEPETFECVSTGKPNIDGDIVLLSEAIKVPVTRRPGGEMVPCPLCRPTKPKFETGRMVWFPQERTVSFIGHRCASRHFGDDYRAAERQFRIETTCRTYIAMWQDMRPKVADIRAMLSKLVIPATGIQSTRSYLDKKAPGFAWMLFSDRISQAGGMPLSRSPKGPTGVLKGLKFLAPDFKPAKAVTDIARAIDELAKPLPAWKEADGENEGAREIMRRGRWVSLKLKEIPAVWASVSEAKRFLDADNLRMLERWVGTGLSPFASLKIRWNEYRVELDAESYQGHHKASLCVHSKFNADVPALISEKFI